MKTPSRTSLLMAGAALLAGLQLPLPAAEQVIFSWGHAWKYLNPMGTNPALADTDFNTTWWLKESDFIVQYNGPSFDVAAFGDPNDPNTFDSGTGVGPLGYDFLDYFNLGLEPLALGTILTVPNSGSRFATYFRTTFSAAQSFSAPRMRILLDDGCLIYLDGVLIARVNKSNNTEAYNVFATDTTATNNETNGTGTASNNESVIQSFSLATAGTSDFADSVVITPVPVITAGTHTLAVSVVNNSATSSDKGMGIELLGDDTAVSAITALASNVQRQANGAGFADDTFSFDVTVSYFPDPAPGTGWTSNNAAANGPTAGNYGTVYSFTGFPAQPTIETVGSTSITFADAANPALTAIVNVTAPAPPPASNTLALSAATPVQETKFDQAPTGSSSFTRNIYSSEIGWTNIGAGAVAVQPAPGPQTVRYLDINNSAANDFVTERIDVTGASQITASIDLAAYTTSGTAFEAADLLTIYLESSVSGDFTDAQVEATLVDGALTDGVALFNEIMIPPGTNFAAGNYPDTEFPFVRKEATFTRTTQNFIRLHAIGANDSGSEHLLFDNIRFSSAAAALTATTSNVQRQLNGAGFADDTFSFDVTVNYVPAPAPGTGWTSNNAPANGPTAGNYGTVYSFTGFQAQPTLGTQGSASITFTDVAMPTLTATVSVTAPAAPAATDTLVLSPAVPLQETKFDEAPVGSTSYTRSIYSSEIGWTNTGAGRVAVQPAPGPSTVRYLDVNNSATNDFVTEAVDITGATQVRAGIDLAAYTTSNTGFEDDDLLTVTVESSVTGDFTDAQVEATLVDGAVTLGVALFDEIRIEPDPLGIDYGVNPFPSTAFPFVRKEATFTRTTQNFVRLHAIGANNSGSEHLLFDNVRFTNVSGGGDTDGDGLPDDWENTNFGNLNQTATGDFDGDGANNGNEYVAGTDPTSSASRLAILTAVPVAAGYQLTWSSVAGKVYRIDFSQDLATWTDLGTDVPSAGATTSVTLPLPAPAPLRLYARVRVKP